MESKQLVRLVMERVDAASAEAFAERMGWGFNQVRTIRLWLAGTSAPSYPYLMEMLEAGGMLCLEQPATPSAAPPVDQVEAARALDEAAESLEQIASSLRGLASPRASSR